MKSLSILGFLSTTASAYQEDEISFFGKTNHGRVENRNEEQVMLSQIKTLAVQGVKRELSSKLDQNESILGWLPAITDLVTDISPIDSIIPDVPNRETWFDAINPFPSTTSIKTTAECGVCRWGTWVLRETLGNIVVHEALVGAGRALCPFFIGEAGFVRATC